MEPAAKGARVAASAVRTGVNEEQFHDALALTVEALEKANVYSPVEHPAG